MDKPMAIMVVLGVLLAVLLAFTLVLSFS